jgi:hypothetical protein
LAYRREDYNQAARHYQRALDIDRRLGHQAGSAGSVSQLGTWKPGAAPRPPRSSPGTLHGIPQIAIGLRPLAAYRANLGPRAVHRAVSRLDPHPSMVNCLTLRRRHV